MPMGGVPAGAAGGWEVAGGPRAAGGEQLEPRQRLNPLSPLLKGAKSIVVIAAALSWQTLGQVGATDFALIVLGLAIAVAIFSAVGWWNTGYHVVGRELRITEGLIWRRNRAIPLDRLQAVEVRRPLLAQLTGLAELRLEVVGGSKAEAPLAYLTLQNANALRGRLLALSGRTAAASAVPGSADSADSAVAEPPPLYRVRNTDLLVSQLLTPQSFFLPLGVAWVITQFVMEGSWTFIGIASTVTAMAGVILQPIRRVLRDWNFRLIRGERLLLHYGLVETRSQVVPPHRVQAVQVTWPFLWRAKRWLHLSLDVAGLSRPESGDNQSSDRLMPVGDLAAARALVAAALPGVDLAALATSPPPRRAAWLHPVGLRFHGAGLDAEVFVSRSGRVTREMTLVPYARVQSVRVVQGPVQRRLGLATVYADTAGGRAGAARDRHLTEAYALADQLALRARQARTAAAPASPPPAPAPASFASPVGPAAVPEPPPTGLPNTPMPNTGFPNGPMPNTGLPNGPMPNTGLPNGPMPSAGPVNPVAPASGTPGGPEPVDEAFWRRPEQP